MGAWMVLASSPEPTGPGREHAGRDAHPGKGLERPCQEAGAASAASPSASVSQLGSAGVEGTGWLGGLWGTRGGGLHL